MPSTTVWFRPCASPILRAVRGGSRGRRHALHAAGDHHLGVAREVLFAAEHHGHEPVEPHTLPTVVQGTVLGISAVDACRAGGLALATRR